MPEPQKTYLDPTQEAGRDFMMRGIQGEVVMLNLLKFRDQADYSASPELEPEQPISGAAAYEVYMEHTRPFLEASGGSLDFIGEGGAFLIGPGDEHWDLALLVRQQSVESFMAFASDEAYGMGLGHRTAAISDSRLLPLVPRRGNGDGP